MNALRSLPVIECIPSHRLFSTLPPKVIERLDAISSMGTYPKGAFLFGEGQQPCGVFIICGGRVRLSTSSADGKELILRFADSGDVVGLPGTISGQPYGATAEAIEPIQANFIPRDKFLHFLKEHGEAAVCVAEILSDILHATYQELRYLGLSGSASEKFARLLLDLTAQPGKISTAGAPRPHATLTLTHEEIGETVGLSRETITRLFADFKRRHLVEIHGSTLTITNKAGLEKILEGVADSRAAQAG